MYLILLLALTLLIVDYTSSLRAGRGTSMVSKYISSKKPIFVAGGSKGVGMEVVKQLTSMGNPVECLVRRQEVLKS